MYRIIAILALLGALGAAHIWDKGVAVDNAIELTTGRLNKEWQEKLDIQLAKKDKAQKEISESHYKELTDKDAKLTKIERDLNTALVSLSKRPPRSESSIKPPSSTETPQTCTGRELYREDAEFLTREASRADKIVVERDYYYNSYNTLVEILEQLRK